ncbi:hypothetical protein AB6A40_004786 [Gnathostoma spinigerum]|uniref:UDP-glucuronosyltransferase n=1 Tax=Gnathostoma spinigerum TaxID=75299 RepID=A0ABD6EN20_9BILA
MLILRLSLFLPLISGYKILIYAPKFAYSHLHFLGSIADTLVRSGHDVVMFVPELDPLLKSNGSTLARSVVKPFRLNDTSKSDSFKKTVWIRNWESLAQIFALFSIFAKEQAEQCRAVLADEKILDGLRAEHFDLGITEFWTECGFAVFDKIGLINIVGALATGLMEFMNAEIGLDFQPSYMTTQFTKYSDKMSYMERVDNLITFLIALAMRNFYSASIFDQAVGPYIRKDFSVKEKMKSCSFIFVNSDELLAFPQPINHKIVYVGGIAVKQPKPLSEKLQYTLESASDGAVLVSFGTMVSSADMPKEMEDSFLAVFRKLSKVKFIWKYENESDTKDDPPNLIRRQWIPQMDLLVHRNLRAFITHGGLNSITEAVNVGVPLMVVPLFGDQWKNAQAIKKRGVGVIVDRRDLSEETITTALEALLSERYQLRAKHLAKMIRSKPMTPQERVVKYTEFAAEFGPITNFNPASLTLNVFQFYMLDILIPFIVFALIFLYFIFRLVVWTLRCILHQSSSIGKAKEE